MDVQFALQHRVQVEEFQRKHRVGLLTLLFTDIVGSTKLKQQLGDGAAGALLFRHHELVRELLARSNQGEEIDRAGDSFFIVFAKPSDAVRFALCLQAELRQMAPADAPQVRDRIGIHVGEVFISESQDPKLRKDLYGIQVDATARIMSLAHGDQILMSRFAFDNARQVLKGESVPGVGCLRWVNHGFYELKGVEEPTEICEVGEDGPAPVAAPANSEKARRTQGEGESVLGWRPALDQPIPGTEWILEEMLGTGGFGEVWLGRHKTLRAVRVFKFCFRADRVRSLKREVRIFRILQERFGSHPNIVGVLDVYFDEPPYYIMMDYARGKNLRGWCEEQGGPTSVPLTDRLEIIAQVADALQAAHDAGVVHRDVKPANIIVHQANHQRVEVKLTDFGIGQVMSEEFLTALTRPEVGRSMLATSSGSQGGTQLYMAPELLAGKPASPRSDIYSLGVTLYQLVAGDFELPVTTDWQRRIQDPLLKEDLTLCFAGNPEERFAGASQLARNLRSWGARHAARAEAEASARLLEKTAYRRGVLRTAGVALLIVVAVLLLALSSFHQADRARRAERDSHQHAVRLEVAYGTRLLDEGDYPGAAQRFLEALRLDQGNPRREQLHRTRIASALQQCPRLVQLWAHDSRINQATFSPDGRAVAVALEDGTAHVWEVRTGQERFPPLLHSNRVSYAIFSSQNVLATACGDGMVYLWDGETGRPLRQLAHAGAVSRVDFDARGERLVSASAVEATNAPGRAKGQGSLWEVATGRLLRSFPHENVVYDARFSPNGLRVVTASGDHTACVWNLETQRKTVLRHLNEVVRASFNAAGTRVVTASRDKSAVIWDIDSGETLGICVHENWLTDAVFSRDDSRVLTTSFDQTARVWDAATGRALIPPIGHKHSVMDGTFSSNGTQILTAHFDQTARLWDAVTGEAIPPILRHSSFVLHAAFSPGGDLIMTVGGDNIVRLSSLASPGSRIATLKPPGTVAKVAFSPDGKEVATASWEKAVGLWDARTGHPDPDGHLQLDGQRVELLAFSPDGRHLATSGRVSQKSRTGLAEQRLELWTLQSHQRASPPRGAFGDADQLAFTRDGKSIVLVTRQEIRRWPTLQTNSVVSIPLAEGQRVLAFNSDGTRFLTRGPENSVQVREMATGRIVGAPLEHHDPVRYAAFNAGGDQVVTTCSTRDYRGLDAQVWSAQTGRRIGPSLKHLDGISHAAFSPSGPSVATASEDGTAGLWDLESGRPLIPFLRHAHQVTHVSFAKDGQLLVTASRDHTARVWDAETGEPVTPPLRHPQELAEAWLNSTGDRLVARGDQGDARLWDLSPDARSLAELETLTRLLSSRQITASGGFEPLGPKFLREAWEQLGGRLPETSRP